VKTVSEKAVRHSMA